MEKLELIAGIIGISSGNGHPYSWAAICNGYDPDEMEKCPFQGIPAYLKLQNWPTDQLTGMRVEYIWTQNLSDSLSIAKAAKIPYIVDHYSEFLNKVDVVLLARDDSENHYEMSSLFLQNGIPIFIDKPFTLSLSEAIAMLNRQKASHHIFTCSALRYAEEICVSPVEYDTIGKITYIKAISPKFWSTYGVHLLEPVIKQFGYRGQLLSVKKQDGNYSSEVINVVWENLSADFVFTGNTNNPIEFTYYSQKSLIHKTFSDSFSCFKKSLSEFQRQVLTNEIVINRNETLEIVKILELGSN